MSEVKLKEYEKQMVLAAKNRWRSTSYRWGHVVGWLGVPTVLVALMPTLGEFRPWLLLAATIFFAQWYFFVSQRIIGRLASNENANYADDSNVLIGRSGFDRVFCIPAPRAGLTLGAAILTPLMYLFNVFHELPHVGQVLAEIFAFFVVILGASGVFGIILCYAIALTTRNAALATKWLKFGIALLAWAVILFPWVCLVADCGKSEL